MAKIAMVDPSGTKGRPACAFQPQASCAGTRAPVPVLSHVGREFELRRDSTDEDMHELSRADLDQRRVAGACAAKLGDKRIHCVDEGPRPAGLRLLQS